jgi:DNA-binding SARP family transcriptional activator
VESWQAGNSWADVAGLRIRLMGELQVARAGSILPLPASKRTRALLGYVAALGRPHLRQTLCNLLWDGPDDPRASLRWSLTKLRPLLNDTDALRLDADRERVSFAARGAIIDVERAASLLTRGVAHAETDALEEAAALLSGEFLEGLELPSCYRFHHWCMAERERLNVVRCEVLAALVARLHDQPVRALSYARALVTVDPLSEPAHASLVRLLARLGRKHEALAYHDQACAMLRRELAAPLSGELSRAVRQKVEPLPLGVAAQPDGDAGERRPKSAVPAPTDVHPTLTGRTAER